MRRRRRLGLLAVVLAGLYAPGGSVRADTATVGTSDEAWYSTPPTCSLPTGCGPTESLPPNSRYPEGTLHVGVLGGQEEARTYLKLDLSALPSDATLTGGTLILPVAGSDAGTSSPETAQLQACWMPAAFTPASGSFAPPPQSDCATRAPATFTAGAAARFSVDLSVFARRWAADEGNNGIALVPAPGTAPGTTWHVAFAGRNAADGSPPAAELTFDAQAADMPAPEPLQETVSGDLFVPTGPLPALVSPPPQSPAAAIVEEADRAAVLAEPVVETGGPGFEYPVVMTVPLLLLTLGGYLGWALTRPVVPAHT